MADNETTTILVKRATRDALAEFGDYDETMDDIISKLIKTAKEKKK